MITDPLGVVVAPMEFKDKKGALWLSLCEPQRQREFIFLFLEATTDYDDVQNLKRYNQDFGLKLLP